MAKGDLIFVGIRGEGAWTSGTVTARQNGRTVKTETVKENGISWLVVQETTRGGTVVDEIKVQLNDVVLIKMARKEG